MKKLFSNSLIILFLASAFAAFGQKEVYISKDVLKTSEWANFAYKNVLKKAIAGDGPSITDFFKFNSAVDGVEALEHNVTCLEMIPLASDDKVANALLFTVPKLKKVVLDRIVLAQGRTQKAELKKPMASWAPKTWAVLNNQPLPAPPVSEAEMAEKMKNIDAANEPAPGEAVRPSLSPAVKTDEARQMPAAKKQ